MNSRAEINQTEIAAALRLVGSKLNNRVTQQGGLAFISPEELLGAMTRSYHDLLESGPKDPVLSPNQGKVMDLIEVAVTAIYGIASLYAIDRQGREKK